MGMFSGKRPGCFGVKDGDVFRNNIRKSVPQNIGIKRAKSY
jgi:hypothetical protein